MVEVGSTSGVENDKLGGITTGSVATPSLRSADHVVAPTFSRAERAVRLSYIVFPELGRVRRQMDDNARFTMIPYQFWHF